MATPGKRPFWMHQAAEYVIAAVFVAQGLQSTSPAIPSALGGLVLLNAACAKGPLAAFRLFGRKLHRLLDLVVIGIIVVMAVQPVISLDNNTRVIMGVLAFVIAFVWLGSDFSETVKREQTRTAAAGARVAGGLRQMTGSTAQKSAAQKSPAQKSPATARSKTDGTMADALGRKAGRLAGKGVNLYRTRKSGPPPQKK